MLTKKELVQKFQKEDPDYWKVELFEQKGFIKKKCISCGKTFWTLEEGRQVCPDQPCQNYEFLGKPPTKKRFDYIQAWKAIEKFFVKNGHESIRRYPVVARWRPDLFFTVASIIDFQRVENGKIVFELPANPLIVPQMCLRFNDIPNVGITGKHSSAFVMVGQHALFNGKSGYWKDRCIELDFKLLTDVFGVPEKEIVFLEDAWLGYGAFGLSLEYFVRGLEIGNAVFTEFLGTPESYKRMDEKVIDMGAGLERFSWISQGTPTVYDAVFGPVIDKLKKATAVEYDEKFFLKYAAIAGNLNFDEVKDMEVARADIANRLNVSVEELKSKVLPLEALYSIADHTKALVFAITDSGLPSNVGGGYNLRVVLRRALNFINKFGWDIKLADVADWHVNYLKKMFPELAGHTEGIEKILEVEEKRYKESKQRAQRIVERLTKQKKSLSEDDMIKLYDSDGITPELMKEAGLDVSVPKDFYVKVTDRHMGESASEEKVTFDVSGLPETKILFYDSPELFEFKAKVLKIFEDKHVVLDQTLFYPTSGGQLHDKGSINGMEIVNVQKIHGVVIHELAGKLEAEEVVGKVDENRRRILMRHHTATHIVNYAARELLGKHVWQHGAEKDIDKARLDITHYESLSDEEVEKIENLANKIVEKNLPVSTELLSRVEAEKKYGFAIYQGGAIPERNLRIISINKIDHEACGGTHCKNTNDVGYITILRTKRIADGICRIEFCSGDIAVKQLEEKETVLKEVAKQLGIKENDVPRVVEKLFKDWKKKRKEKKK